MFEKEAKQLQLSNEVSKLRNLITLKHPSMGTLLESIKKALEDQPENLTLLSEEEIGTICDGLKTVSNIVFNDDTVKAAKKSGATKSLKSLINNLGEDAF